MPSDAVFGAGVDGDTVLFVAGGCDAGLAGAAAVELGLDVGLGEGQIGRAVVDDARDGLAVGLARAARVSVNDPARGGDWRRTWSRGSSGRRWTWRR